MIQPLSHALHQDPTFGVCLISEAESEPLAWSLDKLELHLAWTLCFGSNGTTWPLLITRELDSLHAEQKHVCPHLKLLLLLVTAVVMLAGLQAGHDLLAFPKECSWEHGSTAPFPRLLVLVAPYLLPVMITLVRRVGLIKTGACLSRAYCLWTARFPGPFCLHSVKSSPVGCRLREVSSSLSLFSAVSNPVFSWRQGLSQCCWEHRSSQ